MSSAVRRLVGIGLMVVVLLATAGPWSGCGGDSGSGDGGVTRVSGNIASVSGQSARSSESQSPLHALRSWLELSTAEAQACTAARVLYCLFAESASGGRHGGCEPVGADTCLFDSTITVLDGVDVLEVSFVDDVNGNGKHDDGEPVAMLANPLGRVCNGSELVLGGVALDFANATARASAVTVPVDTCESSPKLAPTATPTRRPRRDDRPEPTNTASPSSVSTKQPAPPTLTPAFTPTSTPTPIPQETCFDSLDNDQDGMIDCEDPDCESQRCTIEVFCERVCAAGQCILSTLEVCVDNRTCLFGGSCAPGGVCPSGICIGRSPFCSASQGECSTDADCPCR